MFKNKKELRNVLSLLVFCPHDKTYLLLLNEERGDYWIPSMPMDDKDSWKENLRNFKKKLFDYDGGNEKLHKIYKIWTLEKDFFHLVFLVNLPKEIKSNCKTQTLLGKVGWYDPNQILELKQHLRSLEVLEMTCNTKSVKETEKISGEILPIGALTEVKERDILMDEDNCPSETFIDLLQSAGLQIEQQIDLYEDFFIHTYPCLYMNLVSFEKCIPKFNFPGNIKCLFRAADYWKRQFLTFQDYLFLIAVADPYSAHYGDLAEIRCKYVFRYYADNLLNYQNFSQMILDTQLAKNPDISKMDINKQIHNLAGVLNFKLNSKITFEQFYDYVLQAKIRDTSFLLRFRESHLNKVSASLSKDTRRRSLLPSRIAFPFMSKTLLPGPETDYKVEIKMTIIKPGESAIDMKDLHFMEDVMSKSLVDDFNLKSNLRLMKIDPGELEPKIKELIRALKASCPHSAQAFFYSEELDDGEISPFSTMYLEKLGVILIMICEHLKEILKQEPRLLQIDPPVYIMGDIHGNFHDVMCFEKALWPNGLRLAPTKLLFLGDFVDRGKHSLEVIMYLFANKLQNPKKLFLVRGNHEIREIQRLFTFERECIFKLGPTLGAAVWKAVNDVFDTMPLAAVIDQKVFCCHGGIPPPWLCPEISIINLIPCPLPNPERQSPLAWTMMWNDPFKSSRKNSFQDVELLANDGFAPNTQRGTGFYFNCEALENFLSTNKLSHVVRAHEVVKAGFQIQQKGKLVTVFSSSGYCGGNNFAASVLVADNLLRVFMVDTGIN